MKPLYDIFIGGSWITSLIGYALAVAVLILPILQGGRYPNELELLTAAISAFIGRFSQHDVGGAK